VEVTDIMTAFYLDRMAIFHAAKIVQYERSLGGADKENDDSDEDSEDENELVVHDRKIVATAEEQDVLTETPTKLKALSLSTPLGSSFKVNEEKRTRNRRSAIKRNLMEAYRARLRDEWRLEIRQDDILEDEFTHRFGPVTATEALASLSKVCMSRVTNDQREAFTDPCAASSYEIRFKRTMKWSRAHTFNKKTLKKILLKNVSPVCLKEILENCAKLKGS
jgi:hypothetical protein